MKRIYQLIILLISISGFAQDSVTETLSFTNNCANPSVDSAGVVIRTKYPFTLSYYMPTVQIVGYNYGTGESIDLTINWYIYQNGQNQPTFYTSDVSSAGGFTPEINLLNENGFVSIYIRRGSRSMYCQSFRVKTWLRSSSDGGSSVSWFQGWTGASLNSPPIGSNKVTVPYKNRMGSLVTDKLYASNIGIGKPNSSFILDAAGAVRFDGSITNLGAISINSLASTQQNDLNFTDYSGNRVHWSNLRQYDKIGGYFANRLFYKSPNGPWENMALFSEPQIDFYTKNTLRQRIDSLGRVGFGNNASYGKVEAFYSSSTDGGDKSYYSLHRSGQIAWQIGLKENNFVIASGGGTPTEQLFPSKKFIINSSGNVGIGTEQPVSRVHIEGGEFRFKNQNGYYTHLNYNNTSDNYFRGIHHYFDYGIVNIGGKTNHGDFKLQVDGGAVFATGRVGIGTSIIPADYLLAVNGKIITEKVVVRKNENWPDFVFSKDYELPELKDVERFLIENQHLPEIPTAKEIEENGHDLAEMNRLLLKKVEELTLYILELKKENEAIPIMQKDIELLKTKILE